MADNDTNTRNLKKKIETLKDKVRSRDERIGEKDDELVTLKEKLSRCEEQITTLTSDNERLRRRSEIEVTYQMEPTAFMTIERHTAVFLKPGCKLDNGDGKKVGLRLSTQLTHGLRDYVADLLIANGLETGFHRWTDYLCQGGRDGIACKSCQDERKLCVVLVNQMAVVLPLSSEPPPGIACLSHYKAL